MKLKECLDRCLVIELRAMSRELELKLQSMLKRDVASQLERRILLKAAEGKLLKGLPDEAQSALADLLNAGGTVALETLQTRFGPLRRPVPGAIESAQPWADRLTSPLDRLHVRGMLFRSESDELETAIVPEELVASLRPREIARPLPFRGVTAPPSNDGAAGCLIGDLTLLVSSLTSAPAARLAGGGLARRDLLRLNSHLLSPDDIGDGPGERAAPRLSFLRMLAEAIGLISEQENRIRSTESVEKWLELPIELQHDALNTAYLNSGTCWELGERSGVQFTSSPDEAVVRKARAFLLELLSQATPGEWYSISSLIQAARNRNPLLLRKPDDHTTARCLRSGAELTARDWNAVEGAWIESALTGPLHWLGLVSTGRSRKGEVTAFRTVSSQPPAAAERSGETTGTVRSLPDMTVEVGSSITPSRWFRLERICDLQSRGETSCYSISREKVRESLQAGVTVEAILRDLGPTVPDTVRETITGWANRFGQVRVLRATVIASEDATLMSELRSNPAIAGCLDQRLGRGAYTVKSGQEGQLVEQLRRCGELPHVQGEDTPRAVWTEIVEAMNRWKKQARLERSRGPSDETWRYVCARADAAGIGLNDSPEPENQNHILALLEQAIQQKKNVFFECCDSTSRNQGPVVVAPRGLVQVKGVTYLSGYRKGGSGLDRFRLDCIKAARIGEK